MPSGVYIRTEKHKEICRLAGLKSPTKMTRSDHTKLHWQQGDIQQIW